MDSPIKSAPLTLLMDGTALETLAGLRSLLDGDSEFVLAHASPPNTSSFEIIYKGVSLQLAINAQTPDLTGLKRIFCNLDAAAIGSGIDISLGEHVAGGERVPPIVQALLGASAKLGSSIGAVAMIWHPAQTVSGFDYFSETVRDYLAGGAFPVLAMVNFKVEENGAMKSTGLGFLAGQELQIASNGADKGDLMHRFVQAAHDLATNEPFQPAA